MQVLYCFYAFRPHLGQLPSPLVPCGSASPRPWWRPPAPRPPSGCLSSSPCTFETPTPAAPTPRRCAASWPSASATGLAGCRTSPPSWWPRTSSRTWVQRPPASSTSPLSACSTTGSSWTRWSRTTRPPAVRGPRHKVKVGKTPVLEADQARALLDSISTDDPSRPARRASSPQGAGAWPPATWMETGTRDIAIGESTPDGRRVLVIFGRALGERTFVRGRANADTQIDLSDAVFILGYLFLGSSAPECFDAADVNDSGIIDLSGAVHLLNHLFVGGAPPPPPYPEAGEDVTPDALDCGV